MRKRKGFTLVELVVVIAVIAILAAVLIPTFSSITEKAQHSALISNGRNAYKNLLIELGEHRDCFYQEDGYYIVFGEGGKINELGKHNGTRFKKDTQGIYVLVDENTIRCNEVEIRSIQSILYELAGHRKATEWSKNSTHHWYECQKEDCNEKFDEAEHSFDGIVCNVCDYEKPATEGVEYELNADGQSYYVKGIGTATATEIIIPSNSINFNKAFLSSSSASALLNVETAITS